jgi:hypothetical protein
MEIPLFFLLAAEELGYGSFVPVARAGFLVDHATALSLESVWRL